MTDVMGGHIDGMVTALSGVIAVARAGKLRVLAVTGDQRTTTMPEVPTAQEQGLKGFRVVNWYAIVAPASMQPPQLNALHGAIVKTVANPAVHEKLVVNGVEPKTDATPAAFAAFVRDEFTRWGEVVKQTGAGKE
jgi:tripartite-type tricarboxylate transporter receptor subunit TctC